MFKRFIIPVNRRCLNIIVLGSLEFFGGGLDQNNQTFYKSKSHSVSIL